jgi:hypothetical protein
MGATPPSQVTIYQDQDRIEGSFMLLPYEEKNIRLHSDGALSEYIYFENGEHEMRIHVTGPTMINFYYLPPKDLKPGDHMATISADQYLSPEERIEIQATAVARASIGFVVKLRVPNEGKFLEGTLNSDKSSYNVDDIVYLTAEILNIGTEPVSDIQLDISIMDPNNVLVSTVHTKKIDILNPVGTAELKTYWDSEGAPHGRYIAETETEYGGKFPLKMRGGFRIGDIHIEIVNVSSSLEGSIAQIYVDIESYWNEIITDVYAEIVIKQNGTEVDRIKTSSIDLGAWEQTRLVAYWDKSGVVAGDYDLDIFVYYYDKYARRHMQVQLEDLEKPSVFNSSSLLMLGVVLLAFILILNILFLFKKNKNEKKKK